MRDEEKAFVVLIARKIKALRKSPDDPEVKTDAAGAALALAYVADAANLTYGTSGGVLIHRKVREQAYNLHTHYDQMRELGRTNVHPCLADHCLPAPIPPTTLTLHLPSSTPFPSLSVLRIIDTEAQLFELSERVDGHDDKFALVESQMSDEAALNFERSLGTRAEMDELRAEIRRMTSVVEDHADRIVGLTDVAQGGRSSRFEEYTPMALSGGRMIDLPNRSDDGEDHGNFFDSVFEDEAEESLKMIPPPAPAPAKPTPAPSALSAAAAEPGPLPPLRPAAEGCNLAENLPP